MRSYFNNSFVILTLEGTDCKADFYEWVPLPRRCLSAL
jgi:hypothetical protein